MRLLADLFSPIKDQPVPGGCDACAAWQTVREESPGVYMLVVHHDDWCRKWRSVLS